MTTTLPGSYPVELTTTLSKDSTTVTTTSIDTPDATPPICSWQLGPIPLISTPLSLTGATDQYTLAASEMALVHNCIIRAVNSIAIQSAYIPAVEVINFINYSLATYHGLVAHHDGEEAHFFPDLERITGEAGLMEENVQGHRDFDTKFSAWGEWLKACIEGEETWSHSQNLRLMQDFMPPLQRHLHDEIPSILALSRFGDTLDLKKMFEKEGEKVMGGMCKRTVLPIFFFNHDDTFEGGRHHFPPLPFPVKWVLKNVFGRSRSEWWKFACCGFDGRPRELRYRGEML